MHQGIPRATPLDGRELAMTNIQEKQHIPGLPMHCPIQIEQTGFMFSLYTLPDVCVSQCTMHYVNDDVSG